VVQQVKHEHLVQFTVGSYSRPEKWHFQHY